MDLEKGDDDGDDAEDGTDGSMSVVSPNNAITCCRSAVLAVLLTLLPPGVLARDRRCVLRVSAFVYKQEPTRLVLLFNHASHFLTASPPSPILLLRARLALIDASGVLI